ncbi:MAG: low molecular weight protein-tyrosine-phosphatase [Limnohabitans sp.]
MIEQVLTVCIGNICRSPAAQALLRHRLPTLQVTSAGLQALDGQGIDLPMLALLEAAGVQAHAHRARTLSSWMLAQSSLVLVMDAAQKAHIERLYPAARGRVFRLGEHLGPQGQDIPDPYRQDAATCARVYSLIDQGVQRWSERIEALGYAATEQAA